MNSLIQTTVQHVRKRRLAFTLIELLVVSAIIAILAALLLLAVGKAKTKAKTIVCVSNMKQWAYAFWMYSDDNEDSFPYEGQDSTSLAIDSGLNLEGWFNTVPEYAAQPPLKDQYLQGNPPTA